MTDIDKATEIANRLCQEYEVEEIYLGESYYTNVDSKAECYNSALEMAEWKEQQMIQRACEWFENNFRDHAYRINDLKKAMKGK